MLIRGTVEKADNVVSVVAERLAPLDLRVPSKSRDFR
jgi:error-prone DNA polymerase